MNPPILHANSLAYFDSFAGLIPCKVVSINSASDVVIRLTANRPAYKQGEIIRSNSLHVVPREAVRVRGGMYKILAYVVAKS